jgi:hypothetical protein
MPMSCPVRNLIDAVTAVSVGFVDGCRAQQADPVVDPQRLGARTSALPELAD